MHGRRDERVRIHIGLITLEKVPVIAYRPAEQGSK